VAADDTIQQSTDESTNPVTGTVQSNVNNSNHLYGDHIRCKFINAGSTCNTYK